MHGFKQIITNDTFINIKLNNFNAQWNELLSDIINKVLTINIFSKKIYLGVPFSNSGSYYKSNSIHFETTDYHSDLPGLLPLF